MISVSTLVTVVVYLIIVGLIWWLLSWLLDYVHGQGMPDPAYKVAKIVLMVLGILCLIGVLLSLVWDRPIFRP